MSLRKDLLEDFINTITLATRLIGSDMGMMIFYILIKQDILDSLVIDNYTVTEDERYQKEDLQLNSQATSFQFTM